MVISAKELVISDPLLNLFEYRDVHVIGVAILTTFITIK